MNKNNLKDAIYLKGKESKIIGALMIILVIIFFIPIVLIFFLRFVFKLIFNVKKKVQEEREIAASKKLSSNKESLMI